MLQRNQCAARRTHLDGILYVVIRRQMEIVHLIDVAGLGILVVHPGASNYRIQRAGQILDGIGRLFLAALCRTVCVLINIGIGIRVNRCECRRKLVLGCLLRIAVGGFSKGRR